MGLAIGLHSQNLEQASTRRLVELVCSEIGLRGHRLLQQTRLDVARLFVFVRIKHELFRVPEVTLAYRVGAEFELLSLNIGRERLHAGYGIYALI